MRTAPPASARPRRAPVPTSVDPRRPLDGLELRDWQVEAFAAWAANGCTGVVEAVTGTGKTRLAVAAARAMLARRGRVLVLVPTLDLMEQWRGRLRAQVPGARIGMLGGGRDDDLHERDVLVATPHSAASLPIEPPAGSPGLLVADEAHRYGAPTWGEALKSPFPARLALTATYERNDDGLVDILGPYFGPVVFSYGFAAARRDGTIAPFRVALVATALDDAEREAYRTADQQVRRAGRALREAGLPQEPRAMIAAASRLVAGAAGTPGSDDGPLRAARGFLAGLRSRRDVAATCAGKREVCAAVAPALSGRRTLVFTDTVDQAELAVRTLARSGLEVRTVHGGLDLDERRVRLRLFAGGSVDALVAPRVLDEGVDVPEADLAVVLAAFRSRRQMVQRLGRVLRCKPDGRDARLVIAYAEGTREDPDHGAHEDFLSEVVGVAEDVTELHIHRSREELLGWIRAV
jgi:superfamily II DNA or RNA helicase